MDRTSWREMTGWVVLEILAVNRKLKILCNTRSTQTINFHFRDENDAAGLADCMVGSVGTGSTG